jgi:hypothetical protein
LILHSAKERPLDSSNLSFKLQYMILHNYIAFNAFTHENWSKHKNNFSNINRSVLDIQRKINVNLNFYSKIDNLLQQNKKEV